VRAFLRRRAVLSYVCLEPACAFPVVTASRSLRTAVNSLAGRVSIPCERLDQHNRLRVPNALVTTRRTRHTDLHRPKAPKKLPSLPARSAARLFAERSLDEILLRLSLSLPPPRCCTMLAREKQGEARARGAGLLILVRIHLTPLRIIRDVDVPFVKFHLERRGPLFRPSPPPPPPCICMQICTRHRAFNARVRDRCVFLRDGARGSPFAVISENTAKIRKTGSERGGGGERARCQGSQERGRGGGSGKRINAS